MPLSHAASRRLATLTRSRGGIALLVAAGLAVIYPFLGGAVGGALVRGRLQSMLGVPVAFDGARAGLTGLTLNELTVGGEERPLLRARKTHLPFAAAFGSGTVRFDGLAIDVERGGPRDNARAVIDRFTKRSSTGGGGGRSRRLPAVEITEGSLRLEDVVGGRSVRLHQFAATVRPGQRLTASAQGVRGALRLRGDERDPRFEIAALSLEVPLVGLRPVARPDLRLSGGSVRVLPTLPLTGIAGSVKPTPQGALSVELAGSYGGAKRTLWTAAGDLRPVNGPSLLEGKLAVRAERFSLDKVADILPTSVVLSPAKTSLDASLEFTLAGGLIGFVGSLDVSGLSLQHEKVAPEPISDLSFSVRLDGRLDPDRRRVEITTLEGRLRDLVGRLSGSVELAPGTFTFKDGSKLGALPKIDLALQVPKISCAKLLNSVPGPVIPRLQGFALQGTFEASIATKIDFADLEALDLGGKVGIDGCRVTKAPEDVTALGGGDSIVQIVEVPPRPPGEIGTVETLMFPVGPDNPEFAPYEKISPHVVNAIMTTEDNGFFKHRGWVSPEFKTALKRNLANGGFRLGASSITMQTVKNLLLSHEKTLSRKLQELFLVWYLEQILPKERILELYLNAIEFGPRLYGIGAASRHYFGKAPSELGPLEAAFFSSILPSPKRRYVQYCHGALTPQWDKYVRRIVARMRDRGRLTDEEFQAVSTAPFQFDVSERSMNEKECLDWVKRITHRPEQVEPEADGDAAPSP